MNRPLLVAGSFLRQPNFVPDWVQSLRVFPPSSWLSVTTAEVVPNSPVRLGYYEIHDQALPFIYMLILHPECSLREQWEPQEWSLQEHWLLRYLSGQEETGSALTCVLLWGPSASQMSEIYTWKLVTGDISLPALVGSVTCSRSYISTFIVAEGSLVSCSQAWKSLTLVSLVETGVNCKTHAQGGPRTR